jgi:hypothetical protein
MLRTTAKFTATTASTPTGPKATSHGFAAWCRASTITLARNTCTSMRIRPYGWKVTAAVTMVAGVRAGAERNGLADKLEPEGMLAAGRSGIFLVGPADAVLVVAMVSIIPNYFQY